MALTCDGFRHNWIRDSYYFETTEEPDLQRATTNEVIQTRWLTVAEIRKMYDHGDCCLNMKDIFGFEDNPVPSNRCDVELPSDDEIYAQIAFQEQFFSGVLIR